MAGMRAGSGGRRGNLVFRRGLFRVKLGRKNCNEVTSAADCNQNGRVSYHAQNAEGRLQGQAQAMPLRAPTWKKISLKNAGAAGSASQGGRSRTR